MTSAVVLIDRSLRRLRDMLATGSVSELQRAINEIDTAGEIIVSTMESVVVYAASLWERCLR